MTEIDKSEMTRLMHRLRSAGVPWILVLRWAMSPANSHLFDFSQGWLCVVGIGVAGGMAIGRQAVGQPAGHPA